MIDYNRGDVILINFTFSDETGVKHRPAVIISSIDYMQSRQEAIIAAITSRIDRILIGDYLINDWRGAGLLSSSVSTGIIRTIKQSMIARKLGSLSKTDMEAIDSKLKVILNIV